MKKVLRILKIKNLTLFRIYLNSLLLKKKINKLKKFLMALRKNNFTLLNYEIIYII